MGEYEGAPGRGELDDVVVDEKEAQRLSSAAARDPRAAAATFEAAEQLRSDAYAAFTGVAGAAVRARLGAAATAARRHQRLVVDDRGARWEFEGPLRPDGVIDRFALQVADLLVGAGATRIGRCPGRGCGWLFVNTSGRRRWCQMEVCGNRAKQAAHLARLKG